MLKVLLDRGAQPVGAIDQCYAVAIDARAPKYDGGIASRVDAVPFAVVLNKDGKRFMMKERFWPKRYAIWGRPWQLNQIRLPTLLLIGMQ